MSLEDKSRELKEFISGYETQWFLGELSGLMKHIHSGTANDQLGELSSPLRQLYYLGGLIITSPDPGTNKIQFNDADWGKIISLLNDIELEYSRLFFPKGDEKIDDEWKHIREVAMPSFLSYFNQGPLNYEEQSINWVEKLYSNFDSIIESEIELSTNDFLVFYENLDTLVQRNFQGFTSTHVDLKANWEDYSNLSIVENPDVPETLLEEMREMFEERKPMMTFMADHGIINRFYPDDLISKELPIEKINNIITKLSCSRRESDFIYYTSTKLGNPLYEKPVIDIGNGMFQVFEVKQILHAIEEYLEAIIAKKDVTKYVERKGKLLESQIVDLFKKFFKRDYKIFTGYFVDGKEQDILFLWREYAIIIEAKGFNIREPLRDPDKAFVRIKDDFNDCIGYGYKQTYRVEEKFFSGNPLRIEDNNGNLIEEIDTKKYKDNDYSIIVTINSFGQIQCDLSTLLNVSEDDVYPWAVKFDDLEVFLLTLIAQKKSPHFFIDYLLLREDLHGKLICSDELEICGGFLTKDITEQKIPNDDGVLFTSPDLASLFDQQYFKGLGFENEKYLKEKKSGNYIFL